MESTATHRPHAFRARESEARRTRPSTRVCVGCEAQARQEPGPLPPERPATASYRPTPPRRARPTRHGEGRGGARSTRLALLISYMCGLVGVRGRHRALAGQLLPKVAVGQGRVRVAGLVVPRLYRRIDRTWTPQPHTQVAEKSEARRTRPSTPLCVPRGPRAAGGSRTVAAVVGRSGGNGPGSRPRLRLTAHAHTRGGARSMRLALPRPKSTGSMGGRRLHRPARALVYPKVRPVAVKCIRVGAAKSSW